MRKPRDRAFLILNILVSILIGAVIYCIMSPEVFFVQRIGAFFGEGVRLGPRITDCPLCQMVRNYLPDIMWGYALVFALFLVSGNNQADLLKISVTAFVFSTVMEILQLTSIMSGTFDVLDIAVEAFAEASAAFVIKRHDRLRSRHVSVYRGKGKI